MIPSIWIDYYHRLSPEEAVLGLQEAGFTVSEFGSAASRQLMARGEDVEKTGLQFRAFMDQAGFEFAPPLMAVCYPLLLP